MDVLKIALNGLQIVSILATAGFAAFGLVSKFKGEDGKLTRAGKIALCGIGLSALLSLTTQTVKAENDRLSAKAAADSHQLELDRELHRFEKQSQALSALDARQRDVFEQTRQTQAQVDRSLDRLELVRAAVGESVLGIRTVGQKQDIHTARMLRTMWLDANRIDGNRIELLMRNECDVAGAEEIPRILPAGARALIRVAPKSALSSLSVPLDSFDAGLLLPADAVTFSSMDQRVEVERISSIDTTEVRQYTRFGPFVADNIGPFSSPEAWRDAVVEILITGKQSGLAREVVHAMDQELEDEEALARRYYSIPDSIRGNDDYSLAGLPCATELYLTANDRLLARLEVRVVQVWQHDEDVRGLVVIKSHVQAVDASALPQFASGI